MAQRRGRREDAVIRDQRELRSRDERRESFQQGLRIEQTFTACGLLTKGNSADFRLEGTAANSVAILALGLRKLPYDVWGGTVVPFPIQLIHYPTGSEGRVTFQVPGGGGLLTVFAQFGIVDPESSFGVGYSNALEIRFQS